MPGCFGERGATSATRQGSGGAWPCTKRCRSGRRSRISSCAAGTSATISTGLSPTLRGDGRLIPMPAEPLMPQDTKRLCYSILTEAQKQRFEEEWELDLSFGVKGLSRFRANLYMQRGAVAGAFRTIPFRVRSFEELGLPSVVKDLCKKPRGLVLVTGPAGSGN